MSIAPIQAQRLPPDLPAQPDPPPQPTPAWPPPRAPRQMPPPTPAIVSWLLQLLELLDQQSGSERAQRAQARTLAGERAAAVAASIRQEGWIGLGRGLAAGITQIGMAGLLGYRTQRDALQALDAAAQLPLDERAAATLAGETRKALGQFYTQSAAAAGAIVDGVGGVATSSQRARTQLDDASARTSQQIVDSDSGAMQASADAARAVLDAMRAAMQARQAALAAITDPH